MQKLQGIINYIPGHTLSQILYFHRGLKNLSHTYVHHSLDGDGSNQPLHLQVQLSLVATQDLAHPRPKLLAYLIHQWS